MHLTSHVSAAFAVIAKSNKHTLLPVHTRTRSGTSHWHVLNRVRRVLPSASCFEHAQECYAERQECCAPVTAAKRSERQCSSAP
jgi:hypothetical protein